MGEVLEEDREEPIVIVGVLISTLSDNMFLQVQHICGQFTNVVTTRLEGRFLQALLQILYVDNQLGLHHSDCKLEKFKPAKYSPIFHFPSVTEGIFLF